MEANRQRARGPRVVSLQEASVFHSSAIIALRVGAAGVEDRIGAPDGILDLGVVAEQRADAAARYLAAGKTDQH